MLELSFSDCTENSLRLVGGSNNLAEGRVDVCIGNQWGTVTHDNWNSREGRVVCRQLGYSDRCKHNAVYNIYKQSWLNKSNNVM